MSKLIDNIRRLAAIIKNENRSGANTAARIGGLFEEIAGELEMKLDETGNGQDVTATFSPSANRENIASGEKLSILFGKIAKWFSDLKAVAFSGKASDLEQDAAHRLVTDLQTAAWSDKYTRAETDNKDAAALQSAKEYAAAKIAEIVNSAPSTLDTLQELAAALGNDPNFATSIMALIGGKADNVHAHTTAQITDFPTALPASGGNADTSNRLLLTQDRPTYGNGMIINQQSGAEDAPNSEFINYLRLLHNNPAGWLSEIAMTFTGNDEMFFRTMQGGTFKPWHKIAFTTDIPTSLPANGGNANTVGGLHASDFPVVNESAIQNLNNLNGFGIMCNPLTSYATPENNYPINEAGTLFYGTAAYESANQIYGSFINNRWFVRGGGGGKDLKTPWKELATIDVIPTSLPANGGNADTVGEYRVRQNNTWNGIVNKLALVDGNGCLEIGKYIDFHDVNSDLDFDIRLNATPGKLDCSGVFNAYNLLLSGKQVATSDDIPTTTAQIADTAERRYVTEYEKALWSGKASAIHAHAEYALTNHSHSGYAPTDHAHSGMTTLKSMFAFHWNSNNGNVVPSCEAGGYIVNGVTRDSVGQFTVRHSLGHKKYTLILTGGGRPGDSAAVISVALIAREANYFTVQTSVGDQFHDGGFYATILTF